MTHTFGPVSTSIFVLAVAGCGAGRPASGDATLDAIVESGTTAQPIVESVPDDLLATVEAQPEAESEALLERLMEDGPSLDVELMELLPLLRAVVDRERSECERTIRCVKELGRAYLVIAALGRNPIGDATTWAQSSGGQEVAEVLRSLPPLAVARQAWVVARLRTLGAAGATVAESLRWAREGASVAGEHQAAADRALAVVRLAGDESADNDWERAAALCYTASRIACGDASRDELARRGASPETLAELAALRRYGDLAQAREGRTSVDDEVARIEALLALERYADAQRVAASALRDNPRDARLRLAAIRADVPRLMRAGEADRVWDSYFGDLENLEHVEADFLEVGIVIWQFRVLLGSMTSGSAGGPASMDPDTARRELALLTTELTRHRPARALALEAATGLSLMSLLENTPRHVIRERATVQLARLLEALPEHPEEPMLYRAIFFLSTMAQDHALRMRAVGVELPSSLGEAREALRADRERLRVALTLRKGDERYLLEPVRNEDFAAFVGALRAERPEEWEALIPAFERMLANADESARPRAMNNLGVVLRAAGRDGAIAYIRAAWDDSNDPSPALNLSSITPAQERDSRWREALESLVVSARRAPQRWQAAALLTTVEPFEDMSDEARQAIQRDFEAGDLVVGDPNEFVFDRGTSFGLSMQSRGGGAIGTFELPITAWLLADPIPVRTLEAAN